MFYFADVPIYRLAREDYYSQRESYIAEHMGPGTHDPQIELRHRAHLESSYGGPWEYNEIIGYIGMHYLGSQVRGEYFRVEAKRIIRTRKKILWMVSHKLAPEKDLPRDASSVEIFAVVMNYIAACRRELPGRYVDASKLESVGPYIDWRKMWDDYLQSASS